jgi:hypothetical protein
LSKGSVLQEMADRAGIELSRVAAIRPTLSSRCERAAGILAKQVASPRSGVIRVQVRAAVYLARHQDGDWGDVPPEDARENELSVREGFQILSFYEVAGERLWVITEADRSSTCILLPEEY